LKSLPVGEPPAPPARWRKDAWYQAARLLAGSFGRLGALQVPRVRALLVETVAGGPACLIDGGMSPEGWAAVGERLLKTDFDEHAFTHEDLAWLDPAYDLAGALLELGPSRAATSEMLAQYVKATGDADVGRRLPVAELVYGALLLRRWKLLAQETQGQPGWADAVQRALAAEAALTWSLDSALADAFPADALAAEADTLWCLDVDGVLEDPALGFPSTTPAGAQAIRLMRSAGAAVILNTGRSVEELRMRCDALRLDGGVAEYGGVIWDHGGGRAETMVEEEASSALERVREAAAATPGVHVDQRYRYSVRCRRLVGSSLKALAAIDVAALARAGGPAVRVVEGGLQTDFAAARSDKGAGLEAAVRLLGLRGKIIAMGDTGSDMSMLQRADRAYVPANASAELRAAGVAVGRARQAGLLEAARRQHGPELLGGLAAPGALPRQLMSIVRVRDQADWVRRLGSLSPRAAELFVT
jgi:hydroxymethylpyrimidine pyrophosphatase-like HAD family hydrolase